MTGLGLAGKSALVVGVANKHSIAHSIASALIQHGCKVGLVSGPASYERAKPSIKLLPQKPLFHYECDVSKDLDLQQLRKNLQDYQFDCLIHSIAFAPGEALSNPFLQTTPSAYLNSMNISAYSLVSLLQHVNIQDKGSVVALSYLGAVKAVPNYNCMGPAKAALEATCRALALEMGERQIRVNAVSAGPLNTLSARAIPGISKMRECVTKSSPLRRNITSEEVANTAAFLCSDLSSGITGQTIYVDGGMSAVAMTEGS